eukprot:SAG25_NODE_848_length_5083_cov_5.633026_6_plen_215_part_00
MFSKFLFVCSFLFVCPSLSLSLMLSHSQRSRSACPVTSIFLHVSHSLSSLSVCAITWPLVTVFTLGHIKISVIYRTAVGHSHHAYFISSLCVEAQPSSRFARSSHICLSVRSLPLVGMSRGRWSQSSRPTQFFVSHLCSKVLGWPCCLCLVFGNCTFARPIFQPIVPLVHMFLFISISVLILSSLICGAACCSSPSFSMCVCAWSVMLCHVVNV